MLTTSMSERGRDAYTGTVKYTNEMQTYRNELHDGTTIII